jgi:hypothetical protein
MSKDIRASRPAVTPFPDKRTPLVRKEELEKSKKSLKRYFVGGGDDIA